MGVLFRGAGYNDEIDDSDPWGDMSDDGEDGSGVYGGINSRGIGYEERPEDDPVHANDNANEEAEAVEAAGAEAAEPKGQDADEVEIPLLRDTSDPTVRAVIRTLAKEGYKAGITAQEVIIMQQGFDEGFAGGMQWGRACGRLYGKARRCVRDNSSSSSSNNSSDNSNSSGDSGQMALAALGPLLFQLLPDALNALSSSASAVSTSSSSRSSSDSRWAEVQSCLQRIEAALLLLAPVPPQEQARVGAALWAAFQAEAQTLLPPAAA